MSENAQDVLGGGEQAPFGAIDLEAFNQVSELIEERQEEEKPEEIKEKTEESNLEDKKTEEATEETEEKKTEEEDIKKPSSEESEKDSSRLTPYFKLLMEEGVFDDKDFDKWDGTTDGIVNLREEKFESQWNQYKEESLDPRVKWLQDNIEQGVPFDYLLKADRETLALDGITEESLTDNVDLQKQIAVEYYKKTTKFSEDVIQKAVHRLEEVGELEDEAKTFTNELRTINEAEKEQALETARLQQQAELKAQQEALDTFKGTLDKTEEVVPGIRVNEVMRKKIYDTLTVPVSTDEQGNPLNRITEARMKDPVNFEIKLAYLFELTKGFTDYSAFSSTGKKKAFEEFEKAANDIDTQRRTSTRNHNVTDTEFLNQIESMYNKGAFG